MGGWVSSYHAELPNYPGWLRLRRVAARPTRFRADDTLWKVAEKYLGDGNRFTEIVTATNAKHAADASFILIQDPNLIVSGAKLWIPAAGTLPLTLNQP